MEASEDDLFFAQFFVDSPASEDDQGGEKDTKPAAKAYLEDHNVVLKELAAPTNGTRLFKDHVRTIFPRSSSFNLKQLQALQDVSYRCKYHCKEPNTFEAPTATFWISLRTAKANPGWALLLPHQEQQEVRYWKKRTANGQLEEIPFVQASDDCLRHEIITNGGKTPKERYNCNKKRQLEAPARPAIARKSLKANDDDDGGAASEAGSGRKVTMEHTQVPVSSLASSKPNPPPPAPLAPKLFQLDSLDNLEKNLQRICEEWIQESKGNRLARIGKRGLVDEFWRDFLKERKMLHDNKLEDDPVDDYDGTRQSTHEGLLVHIANDLGNTMVDWFNQNHRAKQG